MQENFCYLGKKKKISIFDVNVTCKKKSEN